SRREIHAGRPFLRPRGIGSMGLPDGYSGQRMISHDFLLGASKRRQAFPGGTALARTFRLRIPGVRVVRLVSAITNDSPIAREEFTKSERSHATASASIVVRLPRRCACGSPWTGMMIAIRGSWPRAGSETNLSEPV